MNRVGVVRGIAIWENRRNFAVARLRSTAEAEEASSVVVGMQGLSVAIDCRNSKRGSSEAAMLLIDIAGCTGVDVWRVEEAEKATAD